MIAQTQNQSKSKLSLNRLLREFLEYLEVEKGRSLKTISNYDFYLNRFLDFACVNSPADIAPELVRKFRMHLHRLNLPKGGEMKPSTQNYHLIALRSFLKYLAKRGIKTMAAESIELARVKERQIVFLEDADLERLLEAPLARQSADSNQQSVRPIIQLRDKAMLELLFSTGLRVSELVNLKTTDLNMKREEFSVKGKGGKTRVIFISNQARYWLEKYLEARKDMSPYLFVRHDRADKKENQPLTSRSVQRLIEKHAKIAGITKNVTPHTFRHSYATDLLMNGADLRAVQQLLGHSSVTTTQIYTHITDKHLKEVFQAFHARKRKRT